MSVAAASHDDLPSSGNRPFYPPGFRARRGLNWGLVGLLYASFYLCRYNFSLTNKSISDEFGFSKGDMGWIISISLFMYACGQITNGLLTDKIGGKRAMLIGAYGSVLLNIAFGFSSYAGIFGLFMAIRGLDGYVQSFGAPGMIKMNTAWFHRKERGRFAGIFGFMINLGRFAINWLAPALLGGFALLWVIRIPQQHWRWVFFIPACVLAVVATIMALFVKETPESAGFVRQDPDEPPDSGDTTNVPLGIVVRKIVTNPAVWVCAFAYACTGAVRQGVDQWFPRYMQEVHATDLQSSRFQVLAFMIPLVATLGSLTSGYVSDLWFNGRRAPVAAFLYLLETLLILAATRFHTANSAIVFFVLIAFTANSTHSIIGTAAAMDIGGRKMAGFASGCIDSFQYFGGMLAGFALGSLVEKNWGYYFYFMAPFGLAGAALMFFFRDVVEKKTKHESAPGFPVQPGTEKAHL